MRLRSKRFWKCALPRDCCFGVKSDFYRQTGAQMRRFLFARFYLYKMKKNGVS